MGEEPDLARRVLEQKRGTTSGLEQGQDGTGQLAFEATISHIMETRENLSRQKPVNLDDDAQFVAWRGMVEKRVILQSHA